MNPAAKKEEERYTVCYHLTKIPTANIEERYSRNKKNKASVRFEHKVQLGND
jgi:hypothetical protein